MMRQACTAGLNKKPIRGQRTGSSTMKAERGFGAGVLLRRHLQWLC